MVFTCHKPVGSSLAIGLFGFRIAPLQPLFVPAVNKTNMLRGAFGTAFRRLCCIPQCRDARQCPLATACPYKQVFEPSPPPNSERLSKSQDVPRPFIFRAPASAKTRFAPGERFEFGLVLIGKALEFLPHFVLAFRELATQGLGLNRAKCELEKVEESHLFDDESAELQSEEGDSQMNRALTPIVPIYSSADQVFHSPKGLDVDQWTLKRTAFIVSGRNSDHLMAGSCPHQSLKVRFVTPTLLKAEGSVIRQPEFHHLFKRLRDRINALSTFFGSGPLDVDFAGLGQRAEKVRTVSSNVGWEERFRTSSKTRQRHDLSGFTGEAVYEGALQEFLPWLAVGEMVHVGKHTAWGGGWIELAEFLSD